MKAASLAFVTDEKIAEETLKVATKYVPEELVAAGGGEVEINFLGGTGLSLHVHTGQTAGSLKEAIADHRRVPPGMLLQLLHPTGVLRLDDEVSPYIGSSLTAVFTRLPLSDEARKLLRQCTLQQPEEGRISLLEVRIPLSQDDTEALAELVVQVQPRRLILACPLCAGRFASALRGDLDSLEVLQLEGVEPSSIPHFAKILSRCPALTHCYFRSSDFLTAEDVKPLRAQTRAFVVI